MDDYHLDILECIGEGLFGKVFRGRRKFSGQIVALKFVTKCDKSPEDLQSLREKVSLPFKNTLDASHIAAQVLTRCFLCLVHADQHFTTATPL